MQTTIITQQLSFENVSAEKLFNMYADSEIHSAATGAPATFHSQENGEFSAFGGWVLGRVLYTQPNSVIVHEWRTAQWPAEAQSSLVTLRFLDTENGASVELSHIGLPEDQAANLAEGWNQYYWNSWEKYIKGVPVVFVPMQP